MNKAAIKQRAVIIHKPNPKRTEQARLNGVEGEVILRAVLSSTGTVTDIEVIEGLPDGLTELAVASAREIKFEPATENDRPISMPVQIGYKFPNAQERREALSNVEA